MSKTQIAYSLAGVAIGLRLDIQSRRAFCLSTSSGFFLAWWRLPFLLPNDMHYFWQKANSVWLSRSHFGRYLWDCWWALETPISAMENCIGPRGAKQYSRSPIMYCFPLSKNWNFEGLPYFHTGACPSFLDNRFAGMVLFDCAKLILDLACCPNPMPVGRIYCTCTLEYFCRIANVWARDQHKINAKNRPELLGANSNIEYHGKPRKEKFPCS